LRFSEILASVVGDERDGQAKQFKIYANKLMEKNWKTVDKLVNNRMKLANNEQGYDVQVHVEFIENSTILFIAMTDIEFGKHHMVSAFLDEFKASFYRRVDKSEVNAAKSALEKRCKETLVALQSKYSKSVLQEVNKKVTDLKGVMQENIDISLKNVENMHELENKASEIYDSAQKFESKASEMRCAQQCQYYKTYFIIFLIVAAIITIIVVIATKK
jgi:hypothetical protein